MSRVLFRSVICQGVSTPYDGPTHWCATSILFLSQCDCIVRHLFPFRKHLVYCSRWFWFWWALGHGITPMRQKMCPGDDGFPIFCDRKPAVNTGVLSGSAPLNEIFFFQVLLISAKKGLRTGYFQWSLRVLGITKGKNKQSRPRRWDENLWQNWRGGIWADFLHIWGHLFPFGASFFTAFTSSARNAASIQKGLERQKNHGRQRNVTEKQCTVVNVCAEAFLGLLGLACFCKNGHTAFWVRQRLNFDSSVWGSVLESSVTSVVRCFRCLS